MAGELKHIDVGNELTKTEWEALPTHSIDGGVAGDILYFDGATLRRLPINAAGEILTIFGGLPAWRPPGSPPLRMVVRTIIGADAVTAADDYLEVDTTVGPFTITLPSAVGLGGKVFYFKKISNDTNLITLDPAGVETIDGDPTLTFDIRWTLIGLLSNDVNWRAF